MSKHTLISQTGIVLQGNYAGTWAGRACADWNRHCQVGATVWYEGAECYTTSQAFVSKLPPAPQLTGGKLQLEPRVVVFINQKINREPLGEIDIRLLTRHAPPRERILLEHEVRLLP